MPEMPVFCDNCELIFGSGFHFENTTHVTLSGNKAQCPGCHNMAPIPDGLFNFVNDSIEIINAPKTTVEKLEYYKSLIKKLKDNKANYNEIKSELEEKAPELNSLINLLPKNRSELYAFLALILATISFTLDHGNNKEEPNQINVSNIINHYNINYSNNDVNLPKKESIKKAPVKKKKIGRNEKCFCGSGLKFKKCHGKNY